MSLYFRYFYPIFLAVAFALTACTSSMNTGAKGNSVFTDADLLDRTFQIQDVAGRGVIDSSNITLIFGQNGQFSGSMGCNIVFGSYKRSGSKLEFGALGATKKMCAPALMNQEQAILDVLSQVTWIEQDKDGALIVGTADGRSLCGFELTQSATDTYLCDNGVRVQVEYPTQNTARIVYNGQTINMTIAESASGARYTGDGWEWWSKGGVKAYLAPLAADETIASDKGITCRKL
ncbi:MAG: META domain-containing protein [Desulforegulaceae bacterium]|nr:META domain-containing protein [Desulforegulaceae bacterium]